MITTNIRVPKDIWMRLKKIAIRDNVSINHEIVDFIENYICQNGKEFQRKK